MAATAAAAATATATATAMDSTAFQQPPSMSLFAALRDSEADENVRDGCSSVHWPSNGDRVKEVAGRRSGRFSSGTRVVIHGLQHQPALNGHLAVVVAFLPEQQRFQLRPLGRVARRSSRTKFLAVLPCNLREASPSAFIARLSTSDGRQLRLPLVCRVELDRYSQLAVRLMYDSFLGEPNVVRVVEQLEQGQHWNGNGSVSFGVVTSPIHQEYRLSSYCHASHDTHTYRDSHGDDYCQYHSEMDYDYSSNRPSFDPDNEVLILSDKPVIRDLFDAMVDYELLEELDVTVDAGLHGSVPLCRLRFAFEVEQS